MIAGYRECMTPSCLCTCLNGYLPRGDSCIFLILSFEYVTKIAAFPLHDLPVTLFFPASQLVAFCSSSYLSLSLSFSCIFRFVVFATRTNTSKKQVILFLTLLYACLGYEAKDNIFFYGPECYEINQSKFSSVENIFVALESCTCSIAG